MQKQRTKWRADHGARAIRRVNEIQGSIAALADEDLLDLADIFAGTPGTLSEIAAAEMAKRKIGL